MIITEEVTIEKRIWLSSEEQLDDFQAAEIINKEFVSIYGKRGILKCTGVKYETVREQTFGSRGGHLVHTGVVIISGKFLR